LTWQFSFPCSRFTAPPRPTVLVTDSRCFCAASAVFCRSGRRMTCITWCVDRPCRRRAYAGPSLWDRACSALGCVCFDFDWWIATSGTLERGQPRQMTGTWSAAWEGLQRWCGEPFASRFWQFGRAGGGRLSIFGTLFFHFVRFEGFCYSCICEC